MNQSRKSRSLVAFENLVAAAVLTGSMWPMVAGAADNYAGTLYIAGMGGHVATVEVKIAPSRPEPITVVNLGRITLNDDPALSKKAYPVDAGRLAHARSALYGAASAP